MDREQGNALVQTVVADTRPTIEPKLKALEAVVAQRLGVPVGESSASAPGKPASPASPKKKP
jgi:hypothetical protein